MVPPAFVLLEALPRNANGKVDRKAAAGPGGRALQPASLRRTTHAHRGDCWRACGARCSAWSRVGAKDHFLELGGHSLLATQVVSRLRSALKLELPLNAFFETPTLEALASRVDAARDSGSALSVIPPLLPVPRTERLPLSFAQQRLWVLDRFEPGSTAYTILAALRLQGPLNTRALARAVQALMRRHEGLRTTFIEDDQGPTQAILPDVEPALGLVDLRGLPEAEREREALTLAAEEAERPFDLTRAPLLRALLVRLSGQHHLLVVTMHHIISDGWSSGILIRELSSLYEAFSTGEPPRLAPLSVQYADYAVWQRQWLQGDVLESQLAYWRKQLAGAPAALELPTDKPRPPVPSFRGGRVPVRLGRELSASLQALCQREGVTLFMALLAGFQTLLSANSGQLDVSVGSPIAGRAQPELEGLIGCFVNTLVLRTRMEGDPTFRELLGRVREVTLGAYAHQDVPFERRGGGAAAHARLEPLAALPGAVRAGERAGLAADGAGALHALRGRGAPLGEVRPDAGAVGGESGDHRRAGVQRRSLRVLHGGADGGAPARAAAMGGGAPRGADVAAAPGAGERGRAGAAAHGGLAPALLLRAPHWRQRAVLRRAGAPPGRRAALLRPAGARAGGRAAAAGVARGDGGAVRGGAAHRAAPGPVPAGRLVHGSRGGLRDGAPAEGAGRGGGAARLHRAEPYFLCPGHAARGRGDAQQPLRGEPGADDGAAAGAAGPRAAGGRGRAAALPVGGGPPGGRLRPRGGAGPVAEAPARLHRLRARPLPAHLEAAGRCPSRCCEARRPRWAIRTRPTGAGRRWRPTWRWRWCPGTTTRRCAPRRSRRWPGRWRACWSRLLGDSRPLAEKAG